jgi:hypothetical protein
MQLMASGMYVHGAEALGKTFMGDGFKTQWEYAKS